ncbi:MAG: vitamin K epoxide reductase family protein [Actinomycetaceae bacterium]|nr:vitamin K epoxide reductase family protein [Actinomycetaceae bacterium]MDU0970945.1 vitamin K epoxide reductase family protein [Actinomycetaceae bacterium]
MTAYPDADPLAPTPHQLEGGEKRSTAIALVVLSLIGAVVSCMLLHSEYLHTTKPGQALICDVNPLIGCSKSMSSPQGHLLGVPNAIFGVLGFAALIGIAVVLAAGRRIARWLWWCLGAGTVIALVWVVWFLVQSITVFRAICPFCLVVWAMTIPIACIVWTHLLRTSQPGPVEGGRRIAIQARWFIVVLIYVMIVAAVAIGLADKVAMVL